MANLDINWKDKREIFQSRFDALAQINIQSILSELDKNTSIYISKGGISADPNNNKIYDKIHELSNKVKDYKESLAILNNDILKELSTVSKDADLAGLLSENGELQQQIQQLEKIDKDVKVDVDTAIARDELLRSNEVNRHDLFILNRPIKRNLIPYIWGISMLFIAIGVMIFLTLAPTVTTGTIATNASSSLIMDILMDRRIWMALFGSSLIVILFLSLKIAGVFGR
jgi:hypothetical protein